MTNEHLKEHQWDQSYLYWQESILKKDFWFLVWAKYRLKYGGGAYCLSGVSHQRAIEILWLHVWGAFVVFLHVAGGLVPTKLSEAYFVCKEELSGMLDVQNLYNCLLTSGEICFFASDVFTTFLLPTRLYMWRKWQSQLTFVFLVTWLYQDLISWSCANKYLHFLHLDFFLLVSNS